MATGESTQIGTRPLLTRKGLAEYLGVGLATVEKMIASGKAPPAVWIGRRRMFRRAAVERWLAEKEQATAQS